MTTRFALLAGLVLFASSAHAQAPDAVRAQAQREKQPLLDTLRDLVSIESGSADIEGLRRSARSSRIACVRSAVRWRWCRRRRTCRGS